jgi:Conserved TM helix
MVVLASISDKVENAFAVFFDWLPSLVGALAVLIIGYFVAKIVGGIVARALSRAGFDKLLHQGQGGSFIKRISASPSRLLGRIAFWAIMLGTISLAASVLGIAALTAFVGAIWAYLPNVIAALLIFLVAGALSAAIAGLVVRTMGETPTGKIVATAAPILIMAIATFMILNQLKIAVEIVTITYAALIGSIALGAALAFGLGGREVAAQMLQGAYEKGQQNKEQVRRDFAQGKEQAKREAQQKKEEMESPASDRVGGAATQTT